jgi:hypothetical protein
MKKSVDFQGVKVQIGKQWLEGPLRCKSIHKASGPHKCMECGRIIQVGELYFRCHMMKGFKGFHCVDHYSMTRQADFEARWKKAQKESYVALYPFIVGPSSVAFEFSRRAKGRKPVKLIDLVHACDYSGGTLLTGFAVTRALQWLTRALETGVIGKDEIVVVLVADESLSRRMETGTTYGEDEALWSQLKALVDVHTDRIIIGHPLMLRTVLMFDEPKPGAFAPKNSPEEPGFSS